MHLLLGIILKYESENNGMERRHLDWSNRNWIRQIFDNPWLYSDILNVPDVCDSIWAAFNYVLFWIVNPKTMVWNAGISNRNWIRQIFYGLWLHSNILYIPDLCIILLEQHLITFFFWKVNPKTMAWNAYISNRNWIRQIIIVYNSRVMSQIYVKLLEKHFFSRPPPPSMGHKIIFLS